MTAAPTIDAALADARDLLVVRLNQGINLLADRDDLIATVQWDASPADPPAWFTPAAAEVTINGPVALGTTDPAEVNPLTPVGRRRHPVVVGLLCHEASHAHSTRWPDDTAERLADVPAPVVKAAVLLEEPRIEKRQLDRRPGDRIYLRAASRLIILPTAATDSATATRWRAAQAALLTAGRADAGILDNREVRKVLTHCRTTLGSPDLTALRKVWRTALRLADGDLAALLALAARWVDIVGVDDPDDVPDPPCLRGSPAAPAAGGDSTPQPDPAGEPDAETPDGTEAAEPDALGAVFGAAMDTVATAGIAEATAELGDDGTDEARAATSEADRRAAETRVLDAAREHAARVFHGHTATGAANPLGSPRDPTAQERTLARQLGNALRRAQFRERGRTVIASPVPPGRLNGRDAMLAAAQRELRMPVTARPFRQTTRRHTPQPPLVVGIAVDISGSMGWATAIMASTAWIVAHAAAHVGGKSAAVAFGEHVTAVTRPGAVPTRVPSFTAVDGTEMFADAISALDGGLGLTMALGARLVFVVSDGHFVAHGEPKRAATAVDRLVGHGVHVLWLDLHDDEDRTIIPAGATRVPIAAIADIPRQVHTILVNSLRAG